MGPVWTAGKSALGRGLALSCKLQQGGSSHSLDGIVGKGAAQLRSGQSGLSWWKLSSWTKHSDNWRGVDADTRNESDVRQVKACRSLLDWVTGHRSRDVFWYECLKVSICIDFNLCFCPVLNSRILSATTLLHQYF